ncbi:hypothetical protein RirG_133450 [Rhizophagus irregularis DAOM 197198w]|uniref:Kelch-like protein 17 n=1 Tax=Rhizophagus irregularis (strain DAOM 197198w) TaxID=1432141 RepID=A0A015J771_RHIIW|nr:hypothetical protein RirG_133450 [Rhizophagus irregularis DAOM 197198w]
MAVQFFTKLSQNYIELLKDDEYYDIIIEVGEDPNVKIFRAHKNILCYRSPYLRRILASNKKNNDNILAHIKLPKISPEIFQIILDYIYGGILSLNMHNTSKDFLNVLVAADSLHLQELVDYLQKYLINNKTELIEQNFGLTQKIILQSNNLLELQEFCINFMAQSPEKIFKSFDFTLLSEKSLISLIKMDDLQMKEIEVWEHVLKWGLAQNPTLIPDPSIWSDDDFKKMKNTLQHILPSIRFFSLSSKEFLKKVRPYKKLLNDQLYEDIVNSHMDPDSEPANNISPPRNIKNEKIIDSKIVNLDIVSMVSKWIDKTVIINNSKYDHLRELYLPYEFKLLLRGSRDGFTPKKFHELCDGKHNTVTFIKIEGTEEILGGYNPLKWESTNSYGKTEDSFIFSFKNKHIKDVIISKVKDKNYAIFYKYEHGPQFGGDIVMSSSNEFIDYETISYQQDDYEKKFSMEDYEVFQIIKK